MRDAAAPVVAKINAASGTFTIGVHMRIGDRHFGAGSEERYPNEWVPLLIGLSDVQLFNTINQVLVQPPG